MRTASETDDMELQDFIYFSLFALTCKIILSSFVRPSFRFEDWMLSSGARNSVRIRSPVKVLRVSLQPLNVVYLHGILMMNLC